MSDEIKGSGIARQRAWQQLSGRKSLAIEDEVPLPFPPEGGWSHSFAGAHSVITCGPAVLEGLQIDFPGAFLYLLLRFIDSEERVTLTIQDEVHVLGGNGSGDACAALIPILPDWDRSFRMEGDTRSLGGFALLPGPSPTALRAMRPILLGLGARCYIPG